MLNEVKKSIQDLDEKFNNLDEKFRNSENSPNHRDCEEKEILEMKPNEKHHQ
jgi:hypothetical protein